MIELKTPAEIDAIAAAGLVVSKILTAVREEARPGVRPADLDAMAAGLMREAGARSSFLGYRPSWAPTPYPAVLCVSVNDAVVHGIPDQRRLRLGDLLSVDYAVHLDGWCADATFSMIIGPEGAGSAADRELIATTEKALAAGIAAAQPGARLGDIGHAIAAIARGAGYGLLEGHGGHGLGRSMHEDPPFPNEARPGRGLRLRPGLVIAIEPMLTAGGRDEYTHDADGWTVRTADGSRAAHAEHTIAITEDGPRILT